MEKYKNHSNTTNPLYAGGEGELHDLRDSNGDYLSISAFNQMVANKDRKTSSKIRKESSELGGDINPMITIKESTTVNELQSTESNTTDQDISQDKKANNKNDKNTGVSRVEPSDNPDNLAEYDKSETLDTIIKKDRTEELQQDNKIPKNGESNSKEIESKAKKSKPQKGLNAPLPEIKNDTSIGSIDKIIINGEKGEVMQMATCVPGLDPNCAECCAIFTDDARRAAFGYTLETAACECHDICVQDVRDIAVKTRTLTQPVPCTPNGGIGCRGSFSASGPPDIENIRILCANESLDTSSCIRIINNVQFEVILGYPVTGPIEARTIVVLNDTFEMEYHEFARFPSGTKYAQNAAGRAAFREELALIDGSCKVITINNSMITTVNNICTLSINYTVVDKLWKHENLLVSALKPYGNNITVSQEFGQGHGIGPCVIVP